MTDDDHTYRAEPDPAFADRLERELLGRLASPSNSSGVVADQDLPEDVQLVRLTDPDQPAVQNERARSARWLAAAAVVVLVAAAVVLVRNAGDGDDAPVDVVPTTSTPEAAHDGPTTLAKGEDVEIDGFSEFDGRTLNIDAVEEDGEVTGEFRVDNVVVTLECADTRRRTGAESTGRDLILGGEVTEDPDGQGLLVEPGQGLVADPGPGRYVAVGDVVALIIREGDEGDEGVRDTVTLYDSRSLPPDNGSAGSCTELVESVPGNLDGGFFNPVAFGHHIDTGGGNCDPCDDDDSSTTTTEAADNGSSTLARAEDVGLLGDALATIGGYGGQTLNISAATEADGDVTGEIRVDDVVVTLECANTDIDGVMILAGEITADPTGMLSTGQLLILVIREGDPDSVALATSDAGSCTELFESVPADAFVEGPLPYIDVEGDGNIETG